MLQAYQSRWASVRETSRLHPSFSEPSLRWLAFNARSNGFEACLRRIGRKLLIDLVEFEKFIDSHKEAGND